MGRTTSALVYKKTMSGYDFKSSSTISALCGNGSNPNSTVFRTISTKYRSRHSARCLKRAMSADKSSPPLSSVSVSFLFSWVLWIERWQKPWQIRKSILYPHVVQFYLRTRAPLILCNFDGVFIFLSTTSGGNSNVLSRNMTILSQLKFTKTVVLVFDHLLAVLKPAGSATSTDGWFLLLIF